jgi:hypothetical protein
MQRRKFLLALTGAVATAMTAGVAEAAWSPLGTRKVNPFVDHDTFFLGGLSGPTFRRLKIKVTGNGLFVYNLKVVYGNGDVDNIPLRFHFKQGSQSRSINLENRASGNPNRHIRRVEFWYGRPLNLKGRTYVHLYGKS